jgi:hypothetical protein
MTRSILTAAAIAGALTFAAPAGAQQPNTTGVCTDGQVWLQGACVQQPDTSGVCPGGQVWLRGACVTTGARTMAASAAAQAATVTITTDQPSCTAHVNVQWPGEPGDAGIQVNVDNHGAQDDGKVLQLPGGDTLVKTPGSFAFTFTLAKGSAHVIHAWTSQGHGVKTEAFANLDCTTPVPPTVVAVAGPERVVEVPVLVAGPVRVVTRTVTKRLLLRCRRVRAKRGAHKGRVVFVCPKRKTPAAKKPRRVVRPEFTG